MNPFKHPKFTKDLAHTFDPPAEDDPAAEVVFETLLAAGINFAEPIYTVDGDRVRLLAIDTGHSFPVVGEVIDFGAETTWLGRWSASGVYANPNPGAQKHALQPNGTPGRLYLDPALPEPEVPFFSRSIVQMVRDEQAEGRAADFARCIGDTVYKTQVPRIVKNLTEGWPVYLTPQPQVDRAGGSAGRVRSDTEQEYDAAFAEAARRIDEAALHTPFIVDEPRNPNGAPAKLDPQNVRAGFPPISVSKQLIANAKDIAVRWAASHRVDGNLRKETEKLLDVPRIERVYFDAWVNDAISHEAHLWSLAGVYAVAGRLRLAGDPELVTCGQLEDVLHLCRKHPESVFAVYGGSREAA